MEAAHVLLDLRCLQAEAVRDHEARPPAEPVRLEAGEVPVPADLHVLGPLPVDRDGAVPRDQFDLLVARGVLEMLDLLVEGDLLLEPLHLRAGGRVPADPEVPPDDVRDEDAQGLPRASGRPDRARVREVDVVRPVRVPLDPDLREPLEGGDEDPLREDREAHADRAIDRLLLRLRRPAGDLLRDEDRGLLPVVGHAELADPSGDPRDVPVPEQLLDPGREVLGLRDLDLEGRIESPPPRVRGDPVAHVGARLQGREVAADLVGTHGVGHGLPIRNPGGLAGDGRVA